MSKYRRALRGLIYGYLGAEVMRHKGALYCLDCESHIPWRRLPWGRWRYSVCLSCEGFEHVMRNEPLPVRCR